MTSTLGEIFYEVGVMVTVFEHTGSALQTVGVTIAKTLPALALGPFAGVAVDHYSRKAILVGVDLLRAGLVGGLILLVGDSEVDVWSVYAVVAGLALVSAFHTPARLAVIPALVDRAQLVEANSLLIGTRQAGLAAGYALGGMLILAMGFERLILVNMGCFVAAALAVFAISLRRIVVETEADDRASILRDIVDGLAYLRRHVLARPLVIMEVLEHLPHGIWNSALMLVFTQQALKAGADGWGYQNAAFYLGQIAGSALAVGLASWMSRRAGWVIVGDAFLGGLFTLGYALSPGLGIAILFSALMGPASAMRDVAQDSLLQSCLDDRLMGRVYATRSVFTQVVFMLGGVAFAWLADQVNIRWIYVAGGALYLGTGLYALASRAIRRSEIA